MQLQQFDYTLPEDRIAQQPVEPRDHSRLLHLNRQDLSMNHRHFYDLPTLLSPGDVLVVNDTKVLPVRLRGHKTSGGQVEVLLTKVLATDNPQKRTWQALTKPGLKPGQQAVFATDDGAWSLQVTCLALPNDDPFTRTVQVESSPGSVVDTLSHLGTLPTPPYIKEFMGDPQRYQTVFAREAGSAAAPTAGLHFTPQLMDTLHNNGVEIVPVTLHVGLGTFEPVRIDDVTKHHMHAEWFEVTQEAAQAINTAKREGRRVIAVGTTALRTLESAVALASPGQGPTLAKVESNEHDMSPKSDLITPQSRETELFVYPPYRFHIADALITNFHLPQSTLLMLVSAFTSAPQSTETFTTFTQSWLGHAYQTAIEHEYRFFSFGDAMLIE